MISATHKVDILLLVGKAARNRFLLLARGVNISCSFFILCYTICSDWVLSLELECGNFILTDSIAFFYTFGLTSIVTLQPASCSFCLVVDFFPKLWYANNIKENAWYREGES